MRLVAGCHEYGNETASAMKGEKLLEQPIVC
jgi:hypothetical protein